MSKLKMLKAATVFISALFAILQGINSQTFEKNLRTFEDDIIYSAVAIDNEKVIFVLNSGNYNSSDYHAKLFKINTQSGMYLDSCTIDFNFPDYKLISVTEVFYIDSLIIIIGQCENIITSDKQIYFAHLGTNFELFANVIVGDETLDELFFEVIFLSDGLFLFAGRVESGILLLEERDILGNLIRRKTYDGSGSLSSTVAELPSLNKYHLYNYWDTNHSFYVINKDSLSIDTIIQYPLGFNPGNAIAGLDAGFYYVAGRQFDLYPAVLGDFLSFLKVQNDGEIIDQYNYEIDEKITYYTDQSFDFNSNEIFFGGSYPCTWIPPLYFYPEQRWILLYKLHHDGEIIWQKFYKGEVNYMAYKILATSDGGALIFSTRYDWNDSIPDQRDVHILKIDSTGYYDPITGTDEEIVQMQKQILVYPNPTSSEITFVTGLYSGLDLSIYNSTGEKIISQSLPSMQTFDISLFPTGVYFYVVTGKKGFSESGKIIKSK